MEKIAQEGLQGRDKSSFFWQRNSKIQKKI